MTRLLSIFSFGLLISKVLCSFKDLNEEFKGNLRSSIIEEFRPVVSIAVTRNELLLPLLNVTDEIDSFFLSDKNVDETIVDKLIEYMKIKVNESCARNSLTANDLLEAFSGICRFHKHEYTNKKSVLINTKAFKSMADVCLHFKAPVQWLVLTSKVLGHPNLFGDAPTLLENIRMAFLEKFDPKAVKSVDFKVKLKFIKNSFDFYFLQHQPEFTSESSLSIHTELKSEFMERVNAIISDLENISNPFDALSTGLGQKKIEFNLGSNMTSSNEDLWGFIISRIEIIREKIESNCSNLLFHLGKSIVDIIIANLFEKSQNNVPFTLKSALYTFSDSFEVYISLIESARADESVNINVLYDEAENIKALFEADLKKFNEELKNKIVEIKSQYELTSPQGSKFDLNRIAVGSMAFDYLKANHLEKFF